MSKESDSDSVCTQAKDGIHVSVRIRPLSSDEMCSGIRPCCNATSKASLIISKEGDSGAYLKSQAGSEAEFAFDAVFDEYASQIEVYKRSAMPFMPKLIQGENVTIFAYGATGAGKTHTMFGNTRFDSTAAFAGAGIIPQAVADLFRLLDERQSNLEKGESWSVSMSYMEVYNEQVCDLLETANKNLPLREDPERGIVIVAGLSEFKVSSYNEVLELLMKGQVNRRTEATKANIVSSRSHAILQFNLTHIRRGGTTSNITTDAKLSLIDLAGSERASATQNSGARLQESSNINKSLLALANCINALSGRSTAAAAAFQSPRKGQAGSKKTNVKYRDSKLTHLLKGSLEGNCNLVMIANVNPADTTYDDTYRTLQYANRAKNLKVKPGMKEVGVEASAAERELRLKEENEALRLRLELLEQNAQKSNASEQQLLSALAQAMDALNAAKAAGSTASSVPNSPVPNPMAPALAPGLSPTLVDAPLLPLAGKKNKRTSSLSEGRSSYANNPRASTGSVASQIVYPADGEDSDEENLELLVDLRRESDGGKSRRLSSESTPRTSYPASSKPTRLSEDIVQKYQVLADATNCAVRRLSDNVNRGVDYVSSSSFSNGAGAGTNGSAESKISIDDRYQYNGSTRQASPPQKQGFFSRFLCGIKKH